MTTVETLTRPEAVKRARRGDDVFEVRAGIRQIGFWTDYDIARQFAEFYDAEIFDYATGERV